MKKCKFCQKELIRKVWYGNRKRIETNKRWHERQYCNNICRSNALRVQKPEDNYFYGKHLIPWNKGRRTSKGWDVQDERGYIRHYTENGKWRYEHVIVAENAYGLIGNDEVVHHINGITSDNRQENLMVVKRKDHQRIHKQTVYEGGIAQNTA